MLFLALSFPLIFTADEWIAILAETRPVIGSFLLKWVPFSFSEVLTGQVLFLPLVLLLAAEARAGGFILFFHSNIFRFSTPRRFEATPLLQSPA